MHNEQAVNATIIQRIDFIEKQHEYATASEASSTFSKFSQQEFKDSAIQVNLEHHKLITEMFRTLDDIFETHVAFRKMSVTLEELTTKREQDSKAYDDIMDWKRYMKYGIENITILNSFQLKKVRTVLRSSLDLCQYIYKGQYIYLQLRFLFACDLCTIKVLKEFIQ